MSPETTAMSPGNPVERPDQPERTGARPRHARPGKPDRVVRYEPFVSYGVAPDPGTEPVWLYLRLSRYHRDGADAIERQRIDLQRRLAEQGGWTVMGEYVDNDSASASAARTRRGWAKLNEAIDAGQVTAVAFWKLDRTGRVAYQVLEWLGRCRSRGVRLVSHEDSAEELNSAGANGKIVSGIKALFAEIEADTMSVRQCAAKAHLAEAGFMHGGSIPFGWQPGPRVTDELGRTGRRLAPHPVEHPALRLAVQMVLDGHSLAEIAQAWVDTYGIVTAAGRPLNLGNIRRFLTSPRMVGYRMRRVPEHVRGVRLDLLAYVARDGSGQPVISQEPVTDPVTWRRVCRMLEQNATRPGYSPWGASGHEWPLTGLLVCPGCGHPLYGHVSTWTTVDGRRRYRGRYQCRANVRRGKGSCPRGAAVGSDEAEAYVLGWLAGYVTDDRLAAARARLSAVATSEADARLADELGAARAERDELLARQGSGQYRGAMVGLMVGMLADVTDRIAGLEARAALRSTPELGSEPGHVLVARWPLLAPAQKRSALAMVIEKIEVAQGPGSAADRLRVLPRAGLVLPGEQ